MLHSHHSYTSTCLPHICQHTAPHPPHEDSHAHYYISPLAQHRNHPNIGTCKLKTSNRLGLIPEVFRLEKSSEQMQAEPHELDGKQKT